MMETLFIAILVAAVLYAFARLLLRLRTRFRIDIRGARAEIRGSVPGHPGSDVRAFLRDLPLPARCHIIGVRDQSRFRLVFSRNIAEGSRQRIRNYFFFT